MSRCSRNAVRGHRGVTANSGPVSLNRWIPRRLEWLAHILVAAGVCSPRILGPRPTEDS